MKFLRLLKDNIKHETDIKPLLIFDQAPAHRNVEAKAYLRRYFTDFGNVTYSCNFNAIEKVWSCSKREVLKKLLLIQDIDKEKFMDIVM